jgi:hypothetical protein
MSRENPLWVAGRAASSPDDKDASRIAQETIIFLTQWIKGFQITAGARFSELISAV